MFQTSTARNVLADEQNRRTSRTMTRLNQSLRISAFGRTQPHSLFRPDMPDFIVLIGRSFIENRKQGW